MSFRSLLLIVVPKSTRSVLHKVLKLGRYVLQRSIRKLLPKPKKWIVYLDDQRVIAQKYAKHVVLYSEGTSLMSRLHTALDLYEPTVVKALWREIRVSRARVFMDIGANIGLISLAVLKKFPDLRIEAFDPGPHQSWLLAGTIKYNHLESHVRQHRVALADHTGQVDFYIHVDEHVSSDGLIDTGRAGVARRIRVPVQRLDDWWNEAGQPVIPVVKIDAEGSELMILKGAEDFLSACRPVLFLEISLKNLDRYPYEAQDILDWLNDHGYSLETPSGKLIPLAVPYDFCGRGDTYVARPVCQPVVGVHEV